MGRSEDVDDLIAQTETQDCRWRTNSPPSVRACAYDRRRMVRKLAGGQTTESIHTLLDRGMRRQIAVQTEGVRTPIELAQVLKHADCAGRVEPGRAHKQETKFVGFELVIL